MKYLVVLFMLVSNFALAVGNSSETRQPVKSIITGDVNINNMVPVSIDSFKVKIDQAYIDKLIASAVNEKYPDDSIKIIPNAHKKRKDKHLIEKPDNADTNYYLESVISSKDDGHWFAVINNKTYNDAKTGIENLFEILQAGERYLVVGFFLPEKVDFNNVNLNKENKHKYCENINISPDQKSIVVKLFIGQSYDSANQRIYDGV